MVRFAVVLLVVTSFASAQGPRNGTTAASYLLIEGCFQPSVPALEQVRCRGLRY